MLLHTRLALVGSLLFFPLLLAVARRLLIEGLALSFLVCTRSGLASALCTGPQPGAAGVRLPGGSRGRHLRLRGCMLRLAPSDILLAPGCAFTALGIVQQGFALTQCGPLRPRIAACGTEAVLNGKALVAGGLGLLQTPGDDGFFLADARTLCAPVRLDLRQAWRALLPLGMGRRHLKQRRQHHHPKDAGKRLHVSPVSTMRRSSARNSLDCISLSRETVRGNSWASGPSV